MKMIKIFATALIISGLLLLSCDESFLEQPPVGVISESQITNASGIKGLLVGAYSLLNGNGGANMTTGPDVLLFSGIHSDEAFKGSDPGDQPAMLEYETFNVTSGNTNHLDLWRHNYDAVNRCNQVLKLLPLVSDMSDADKKVVEAEARFLRGHFYFQQKRNFNNIPWIDEASPDVRVPNTVDNDGVTFVNVWPQIAADFDFARNNLPPTQNEKGRSNKWAADCYYSKVLIYRANEGEYPNGYAEALPILTNAIANGVTTSGDHYDLLDNYHDNFNCLTENGPESVWAVQHSANDGTPASSQINTDNRSQWIEVLASANAPGLGKGWGFFCPTPFYADQFRTDAKGLPYLDFFDTNPRRLKDDYNLAPAPTTGIDPFEIDTAGVDPRLDWTISRRGIPVLDYGDFPGSTWIRNAQATGPYISKKSFVLKSQDGTFTPPGRVGTAMNIHVIRFADVLLLAAECEAQAGSLDNARTLVNRVRQRMIDNSSSNQNWVKRTNGTDAANYRIGIYVKDDIKDPFTTKAGALNAILFERALELGTEGHRFYDVARFGRGDIYNLFIQTEGDRFDYLSGAEYTEVPDRYLPIPRDAIDRSLLNGKNSLTQNPGY